MPDFNALLALSLKHKRTRLACQWTESRGYAPLEWQNSGFRPGGLKNPPAVLETHGLRAAPENLPRSQIIAQWLRLFFIIFTHSINS
jgi:hypothetical protein